MCEVEKQLKSTNFGQKNGRQIAKSAKIKNPKKTSGRTRPCCLLSYFRNDPRKEFRDTLGDRQTDRRTDRQTDGQTDGQTDAGRQPMAIGYRTIGPLT